MKIILASKSPRRRELLREIISDFIIASKEVDESLPSAIHPRFGVELLAIRKGEAVAVEEGDDALVISSDTLVELDGRALGKPRDKEEARKMLTELSGRRHNVHTGVAVHYMGKVCSGVRSTSVYFRKLSELEILEYISSGECMDKAGSYAIQGLGGRFVEGYDGDFDTVVGLSINLTRELIRKAMGEEND